MKNQNSIGIYIVQQERILRNCSFASKMKRMFIHKSNLSHCLDKFHAFFCAQNNSTKTASGNLVPCKDVLQQRRFNRANNFRRLTQGELVLCQRSKIFGLIILVLPLFDFLYNILSLAVNYVLHSASSSRKEGNFECCSVMISQRKTIP